MRVHWVTAAVLAASFGALCAPALYAGGSEGQASRSAGAPAVGETGTDEPWKTVLPHQDIQGVLGKEVRSSADENMGRIVDVLVDQTGHVRAAVIDFGGFLGVGNRKVVVDWTQPDDWAPPRGHAARRIASGTFALQGHDPGSEVHYRNIKVRILP